jgi:uncharacterized membrane protein YfcA
VPPSIDPAAAIAIVLAGLAAGTINAIVGSGSLITFPTLLALGYPPIVANVSNTLGLTPGSISGVVGYRRELVGQRRRAIRLGAVGAAGGLTGAALLLALPSSAFERIVPVLILVATVLVALQPRLTRAVAARRLADPSGAAADHGGLALLAGVYLTGVYGGYFGAAQGVILIALLAILIDDDLQRLNALKNVIASIVNGVAAVLFVVTAPVSWPVAGLLAVGSICGGQLGAVVGRRFSPFILRTAIVVVGTLVGVRLLIG